MLRIPCVVMVAAFIAAFAAPLSAQQQDTALARLQREIDALSHELEEMRLGEDVVARADTVQLGMGPAASKIYRAHEGVSVGGYGDILYQNFADRRENDVVAGVRDNVDALRLITYIGYKFTPRLLFNSEIEFEHANTEVGGAVEVEFAYLDYAATPALGVRGGLLLMPMGFINELHEPPVFLGTTRPVTESNLIPSTWRENGLGVYGEHGGLSYRAYLVAGLDAIGSSGRASGFSATGLRGGRQHGARSFAEDAAVVARLDYTPTFFRAFMLGGSAYRGKSGQGATNNAGQKIDATTSIVEGHAQLRSAGFDIRALYAHADVDDAAEINAAKNLTGANGVAEKMAGWYVQAGYDVLHTTGSEMQLTPYVRFEKLNTQDAVPTGFTAAPANDRRLTIVGAQFKPIGNVVIKADYQIQKNEAQSGLNQFNVSLGYLF